MLLDFLLIKVSWRKKISFCKWTANKTVFNTDNNQKCFLSGKLAYQISEGSCDTQDWINDVLHHRNYIWKYIKIEDIFLKTSQIENIKHL